MCLQPLKLLWRAALPLPELQDEDQQTEVTDVFQKHGAD